MATESKPENIETEKTVPLEADGREPFVWESRYPAQALEQIWFELGWLVLIFGASLFLIFANWKGWLTLRLCQPGDNRELLKRYIYFAAAGVLGSVTFGTKFFYHAVAKGLWYQDRRAWRYLSPVIAISVALIVGIMADNSVLSGVNVNSGRSAIFLGFLAGYFADEAVGKMYQIANVIFGRDSAKRSEEK